MALLISEWVGIKCSVPSRPKVYELLLSLLTPLDPRNDIVVRMSAATALRHAVDEWTFAPNDFLPYLDAFLVGTSAERDTAAAAATAAAGGGVGGGRGGGGVIGLMASVEHIEAQIKLIGVVEVIVERIDRSVISDSLSATPQFLSVQLMDWGRLLLMLDRL